jgi:hypothetical protein
MICTSRFWSAVARKFLELNRMVEQCQKIEAKIIFQSISGLAGGCQEATVASKRKCKIDSINMFSCQVDVIAFVEICGSGAPEIIHSIWADILRITSRRTDCSCAYSRLSGTKPFQSRKRLRPQMLIVRSALRTPESDSGSTSHGADLLSGSSRPLKKDLAIFISSI